MTAVASSMSIFSVARCSPSSVILSEKTKCIQAGLNVLYLIPPPLHVMIMGADSMATLIRSAFWICVSNDPASR